MGLVRLQRIRGSAESCHAVWRYTAHQGRVDLRGTEQKELSMWLPPTGPRAPCTSFRSQKLVKSLSMEHLLPLNALQLHLCSLPSSFSSAGLRPFGFPIEWDRGILVACGGHSCVRVSM